MGRLMALVQLDCDHCGKSFDRESWSVRPGLHFCDAGCKGAYRTAHAKGPDPEKLKARKRREQEKNKARYQANRKAYYTAHKDKLNEDNRRWREEHPGYTQAVVKRWREDNPDLFRAGQRAAACNRRAKAAGSSGHISRADVTALWERQPACVSCGVGRGTDHIIPFWQGGLNVPENLQNLCQDCNALKQAQLNPEKVQAIRAAYASGQRDRKALAFQFGTTAGNIWMVVTGKTWANVE